MNIYGLCVENASFRSILRENREPYTKGNTHIHKIKEVGHVTTHHF